MQCTSGDKTYADVESIAVYPKACCCLCESEVYKVNILDFIPEGREHAVTREQLQIQTGLSDRSVRNLIKQARQQGCLIVNLQNGEGYYLTADWEALARQYRQNNSRAMNILLQQKFLRQRLREVGRM